MEAAGLYGLAMREGFQALAVLTVSDHLEHDRHLSAAEREQGMGRMAELALEAARNAG
jgi:purine-nucleoside phosphorylase